jgi:prephenate dehydrogenase
VVRIVGAGLIGTSVGAALVEAGHLVTFEDLDLARARRAAVVAGAIGPAHGASGGASADVVVLAVPPRVTGAELIRLGRLEISATVMDTASVKSHPLQEIEDAEAALPNVVLSHPLAGSASAGPDGASAALFRGRSWALCATPQSSEAHLRRAEAVVRACGAVPHWLAAATHDEVVAATSHVPQFVASSLAASIAPLGDSALALSGPTLAEMTRVADSPAELWRQIAAANAPAVAVALDAVIDRLTALRTALGATDDDINRAVTDLLAAGRVGRRLLGVKHTPPAGAPSAREAAWSWVEVQIPDRQGGLATVFAIAAEQQINVEDVRLDHAPYAATGTVALAVPQEDAERLRRAISAAAHDGIVETR